VDLDLAVHDLADCQPRHVDSIAERNAQRS
jgi:hypothetical protein